MNTLNSGKPSSFKDTPRKRIARLFLIIVISIVASILIVPRITLFVRSYLEIQPLLQRARSVMDGTANPPASKQLDGELYYWSFSREEYRDVTQIEVSPIYVTTITSDGDNGMVLTVNFEVTRYCANGRRDSWASYTGDKWYIRKNDDRWIVYKIKTTP